MTEPARSKPEPLQVPPNRGLPLMVAAHNSSDDADVVVNIFYQSTEDTASASIAMATLACPNGADTWNINPNELICADLPGPQVLPQGYRLS